MAGMENHLIKAIIIAILLFKEVNQKLFLSKILGFFSLKNLTLTKLITKSFQLFQLIGNKNPNQIFGDILFKKRLKYFELWPTINPNSA